MNKTLKVVLTFLFSFVVTSGGALMTLWADGVQNFSDVSGPAYATAVISGVIAGVTAAKTLLMKAPEGKTK